MFTEYTRHGISLLGWSEIQAIQASYSTEEGCFMIASGDCPIY